MVAIHELQDAIRGRSVPQNVRDTRTIVHYNTQRCNDTVALLHAVITLQFYVNTECAHVRSMLHIIGLCLGTYPNISLHAIPWKGTMQVAM